MTEQSLHSQICENLTENQIARRWSRFGHADDRLSRAASAVLEWQQRQAAIADDLAAFHAPSECGPLAYAGEERRLALNLAAFGFTVQTFHAVVHSRVDAKTAYALGL